MKKSLLLRCLRILRWVAALASLATMVGVFAVPAVAGYAGWLTRFQLIPAIMAGAALELLAIAVSVALFGRLYCSVVCPLGIAQDIVRSCVAWALPKRMAKPLSRIVRAVRWTVLVLFVLGAAFGLTGLIAPYGIFGRFLSVGIRRVGEPAVVVTVWAIALFALVAAAIALFYTANFITPMYRSSVTIYVNNNVNSENRSKEYVSGGDLSTSQQLVSTYTNMLTSDTVLEQVAKATGLDRSADSLRGMVSAAQVGDTEIFKVYVTSADPVEAATVANAIAQTAPVVITNFVEGSSTKIIDYAKVPTGRFTPSYKRNVLLGFGVGALLAIALLTLYSLLDVRIKEESDLTDLFDIPVLGQIPDLDRSSSGEGHYAYRKYTKYGNYGAGSGQAAKKQQDETKGNEKK